MKLIELKKIIDQQLEIAPDTSELIVEIPIYSESYTPQSVKVGSANAGFDWNSGKFIINPEKPLSIYGHR